jgi:hypothetical protein
VSCTLCRLILVGVVSNRDVINEEFNGVSVRQHGWNSSSCNTLSNGKRQVARTILGAFAEGSYNWSGKMPGKLAEIPVLAKQFPFDSDELVRPWLYGSWWRLWEGEAANWLIGLGVRVGKTGAIEDGEGNEKDMRSKDGTLEDRVTLRGTDLRLRTRIGKFSHI